MKLPTVDLRSDTVTQPCSAMRAAMANAVVGDDVLGDDPTVHELERTIAAIIGTEDALFVPSGTMSNQIAIWLHTRRGDAIAVEEDAHIYHYEAGAPAILSGATIRLVDGNNGIMSPAALSSVFLPVDPHFAPTTLVCVEDTANRGGGTVYPLETLSQIAELAKQHEAGSHLDGARLFNAVAASGIEAQQRATGYDTVSVCFSKGLGAPVGSALCMPREWKERAIRARKSLGGGMRQAGILAAAALYALRNNREKLIEDHRRADRLAESLQSIGFSTTPHQSNMVYFQANNAAELVTKLETRGIRALALGPTTIRMVFHHQVDNIGLEHTIETLKSCAAVHL